jgi:hypothetical protein
VKTIELPLDELLTELRIRRWTLYKFGPAHDLRLVAGVVRWPRAREVDVLLLRSDSSGSAWRAPSFHENELFRPPLVLWEYHQDALWALRAILGLPAPHEMSAPIAMYKPHGECRIPDGLPSPTVVRPLGIR